MENDKSVTVKLNPESFTTAGHFTFRKYEIVILRGDKSRVYNMVTDDTTSRSDGTCSIPLRRLNTHKWNWIAKIQIKIFKTLLQTQTP